MGIIKALNDSIKSTLADQWKEIITVQEFGEHDVVLPGIIKTSNNGFGINKPGSEGVITDGSIIYVPENTAALILDDSSIENIIDKAGGYEYYSGEKTVFNGDNIVESIFRKVKERFQFGGEAIGDKRIVFVNLRELRDIKFGLNGTQIFNDPYYGIDLEIHAYGSFSIKVNNPELFIKNYVPAKTTYYSLDSVKAKQQIVSEFIQSFTVALNEYSGKCRFSELPSKKNEIQTEILNDNSNAGSWNERYGIELIGVAIEKIDLSDKSKEIINNYASKKTDLNAYSDISQKASDISAQQKIADAIKENGLGNAGGFIFATNFAQNLNNNAGKQQNLEEQLELVNKLKIALDNGVLTQEEFDKKKKEILGL